jgi:hypothetical protein
MQKIFLKNKNKKGYAILFTIVIVSAIAVITAGLSSTAYKQLILSSLAKDSQTAFYQSDTASDCGLYADRVLGTTTPPNIITTGGSWTCANDNLTITPTGGGSYTILPVAADGNSLNPCFRITVTKTTSGTGTILDPIIVKTKIQAKGYNICNMSNPRTVEREIEINYQE